ncbi:protein FAM210B, mitochondrial [Sarcophilus harrisii]|uniref:Family with sequence similarity 210 member B n=1 Tax=Sarcophilus harrisii TaxID=9305 RepID=A0A7N4PET8_SARHA|nr:protein FAM210B, mitochondrial [Sarcophilus harrisii]
MVWLLAVVAGRGAAGLRLRLGRLLVSPLGAAAPPAPRFPLPLGPSPGHAQRSLLGTGGGRSSIGGGSGSPPGPQDPKKTEKALPDASTGDESKQSKHQQLRKVFKEYGAVAVCLHIGISLISLGIFYLVVSSGVDITSFLYKLGFAESLYNSKVVAGTSTFVMAYAVHKLFAPVRISITLFSLPLVVRYFRKMGFFKAPGSKP